MSRLRVRHGRGPELALLGHNVVTVGCLLACDIGSVRESFVTSHHVQAPIVGLNTTATSNTTQTTTLWPFLVSNTGRKKVARHYLALFGAHLHVLVIFCILASMAAHISQAKRGQISRLRLEILTPPSLSDLLK